MSTGASSFFMVPKGPFTPLSMERTRSAACSPTHHQHRLNCPSESED